MKDGNNYSWPGWETVKCIGRGGFGAVYEIKRSVAGKTEKAALKVLSIPENDEKIDELYNDGYGPRSITEHFKGHMEEVQREYSIMLDLKGHGNIVYCDDLQARPHDDGIGWDICIKMELLTPLVKTVGSEYNEEQVLRLGKDLCSALIYCRQQSIIHRDIKPQNIFVSRTGAYKLGDFGVAKVTDKTSSGTKIGTYDYMAPEIYRAQQYSFQVDMYSLGLVMYWMMNQKTLPFLEISEGIPTAQEKEDARARRFDGEKLQPPVNGSKALQAVVLKACEFDPAERFPSMEAMLDALNNLDQWEPKTGPVGETENTGTPETASEDHKTNEEADNGDSTEKTGDLKKWIPVIAGAIALLIVYLVFFLPRNSVKEELPRGTEAAPVIQVPTEVTEAPTVAPAPIVTEPEDPCASGHAWLAPTAVDPQTCQRCGVMEGRSLGTLLVKNRFVEDSNVQGSKTDVNVGTWTDCRGGTHSDALRFWVSNSGGWNNTEHIVYALQQQYEEMDVSLQLEENSQAGSSAYIQVYADGDLLYTSQVVDRDSSAVTFTVDISGANEIRLECVTDAPQFAYCIVEAVTYHT